MADALVPSLLKLIPLVWEKLENESRLASQAQTQLESLKNLIEDIGEFLEEAKSREAIDNQLKVSVKRARKFLYASEDAIDDLMGRESNSNWEGLCPYFSHHYNRRTFASVATEIKEMVDNHMPTLRTTAATETSGQSSASHAQFSSACHRSSSIAFSEERDHDLVGIEGPRDQLVQWLTENRSMAKVIFVHGAQGVGKTSLVGAVLRHQRVKRHFKYYVWIEDLRSRKLAAKDSAAALKEANAKMWDLTMGEGNNQRDCKLEEAFTLMKEDEDLKAHNGSWALVMDDTGREDVFESLRSHLNRTRPSVLVTTQIRSLASSSTYFFNSLGPQYDSHEFQHVFLTEDESRSLFCLKMSPRNIHQDDLRDASDRILKKCERTPLAILATCKLLNCKQTTVTGSPDGVEWKKLSNRLAEALLSNGYEGSPIRRMIAPRRDPLVDVQDCLSYLSIFPVDCPIRCSTMMRLWMAEGFIKQKGTQPVQEKAEEILKKLLDYNVIREKKKTSYGRLKTCGVPNLQHQMIISKSIDEEFSMIVPNQVDRWPGNVWYLSFHSDLDSTYDDTWVKQLRSLLVFKKVGPKYLEKLLKKVKRLKVLDLQRHWTQEEEHHYQASLNTFPREILQSKYLKYLSLRNTKVKKIPNGIGDLAYLETLDLKGTNVSELPYGILKLERLRYLLAYRSHRLLAADTDPKHGVKAPSKLGVLTSLQKLCMIELDPVKRKIQKVKRKRSELLEEIGKLLNLQRLGVSMLRSTEVELLCSSIEKLTNLEALHLIAAEGEKIDLSKEDKRKAPEYLQRLHLTGSLGTLPNWILRPDSLVKLVLKRSQLAEDPLQHLGKLWCLKHLELQQAFDVPKMTFEARWFQQLRFLGLDKIDSLESIEVEKEALPTLEILSLARCKSLKTVPQDITRPQELKCLELCDMPEEFNTAVKGNKEVRKHMVVNFKEWKDGALEVVIPLPAHRAGSPSAALPCMK